jgi:hypothetical protein
MWPFVVKRLDTPGLSWLKSFDDVTSPNVQTSRIVSGHRQQLSWLKSFVDVTSPNVQASRSRVTATMVTILTEVFRGFSLFPQINAVTRVQTPTASFNTRNILTIWPRIAARFWPRPLHKPQTKAACVKASPSVKRTATVSCATTGV